MAGAEAIEGCRSGNAGGRARFVDVLRHVTGRFHAGVQLTEAAAGVLPPYLSSRADDALLSVYASLFLTGAVAASRAEDRQTTTAFFHEAQENASRLGRDANAMWIAFGPTAQRMSPSTG